VVNYQGLPAEGIEYQARSAFCEWALRPGPRWRFAKSMGNHPRNPISEAYHWLQTSGPLLSGP
jgi:hypothetical protein